MHKVRVVFEGKYEFNHLSMDIENPDSPEDVEAVFGLHRTLGRVLVIDSMRRDALGNRRLHDAMAAEGLPLEFDCRLANPQSL